MAEKSVPLSGRGVLWAVHRHRKGQDPTPEWGAFQPPPHIHTLFRYLLIQHQLQLLCALDTQMRSWSGAGPAGGGDVIIAPPGIPAGESREQKNPHFPSNVHLRGSVWCLLSPEKDIVGAGNIPGPYRGSPSQQGNQGLPNGGKTAGSRAPACRGV